MRQRTGTGAQWGESDTQPEGSHQEQIHWNVRQAGAWCKMRDGTTPDHSGLLCCRLMYTCIILRGAFISPLMITAEHQLYCLFGRKHKWYALIPYSFIVELGIVSLNAGEMGPITASKAFLWLHSRARTMKVSYWEEKSNQRPLVVFCKFQNQNGKHFLLWLTMVHSEQQIRLVARERESGLLNLLLSSVLHQTLHVSLNDSSMHLCQWILCLVVGVSTQDICLS